MMNVEPRILGIYIKCTMSRAKRMNITPATSIFPRGYLIFINFKHDCQILADLKILKISCKNTEGCGFHEFEVNA